MSSFLTDIKLNNLQKQINDLESDVAIIAAKEGVELPISEPIDMNDNAIQNVSLMTLKDGSSTSTLSVSGGELLLNGSAIDTDNQTLSKTGQTLNLSGGGGSVSLNPSADVEYSGYNIINPASINFQDDASQVIFKDSGSNPISLKWNGDQGLEIDGDNVVTNPFYENLNANNKSITGVTQVQFHDGTNSILKNDVGGHFGSSSLRYKDTVMMGFDVVDLDNIYVDARAKPITNVANVQFSGSSTTELKGDSDGKLYWGDQIVHTGSVDPGNSYTWNGNTNANGYSLTDLETLSLHNTENSAFSAETNLKKSNTGMGDHVFLDSTNELYNRVGSVGNSLQFETRMTSQFFRLSRPNTETPTGGPLSFQVKNAASPGDTFAYIDVEETEGGQSLLLNGIAITEGSGSGSHDLQNVNSITFNDDSVLGSVETGNTNELLYNNISVVTSSSNWTGQYNIQKINATINIDTTTNNTRVATSEFNFHQLNQYGKYLYPLTLTFSFSTRPYLQDISGHSKLAISLYSCVLTGDLNATGQSYYKFLTITDPLNGIKWTGNTGTITVQLPNWQYQNNSTYTAYKFSPALMKQLTGGTAGLTAIVATVTGEDSNDSGSCILNSFVGQWLTPVEAGNNNLADVSAGMIHLGAEEPELITSTDHNQLVLSQKYTGQTLTDSSVVIGTYKVPVDKCGILTAKIFSENSCFQHDMFVKNEDGTVTRTILKTEDLHNPDNHYVTSSVDSDTNQIQISASGKANTVQNWGCRFYFDSVTRYINPIIYQISSVYSKTNQSIRFNIDATTIELLGTDGYNNNDYVSIYITGSTYETIVGYYLYVKYEKTLGEWLRVYATISSVYPNNNYIYDWYNALPLDTTAKFDIKTLGSENNLYRFELMSDSQTLTGGYDFIMTEANYQTYFSGETAFSISILEPSYFVGTYRVTVKGTWDFNGVTYRRCEVAGSDSGSGIWSGLTNYEKWVGGFFQIIIDVSDRALYFTFDNVRTDAISGTDYVQLGTGTKSFVNDHPSGSGYSIDLVYDGVDKFRTSNNIQLGVQYYPFPATTFSFWVKSDGFELPNYLSIYMSSSSGGFIGFIPLPGGYWGFYFQNSGTLITAPQINLCDGAWHNYVCVIAGGNTITSSEVTFYIDGALWEGARTNSGSTNNFANYNSNMYIHNAGRNEYQLSNFAIWKRELDAEEVANIYDQFI